MELIRTALNLNRWTWTKSVRPYHKELPRAELWDESRTWVCLERGKGMQIPLAATINWSVLNTDSTVPDIWLAGHKWSQFPARNNTRLMAPVEMTSTLTTCARQHKSQVKRFEAIWVTYFTNEPVSPWPSAQSRCIQLPVQPMSWSSHIGY